ncbi:core-2/I-Branching enzyme [Limimaricola soesokkakensis]|uniref:Peptide O-xylosyltransferase n=1 Tax=Limimaricola soesokkakensis TaxID=1343159 RepID=A0A1X6ZJ26_9RHOB|nr:DUF5928 domain-containing protein [Limimaricola soesokkakensis]PSK84877.1 core-2/I-Branching enzyme [Limimaricola soesokkakensis]SLN52678.1 Core-2/I-Branching enzyme [Limimaricola soesokkakensis]
MTRIAFILLVHKDPEAVVRQARGLAASGDAVAVHLDARAPAEAWRILQNGLCAEPGVVLVERRRRCGWGGWSLVAATISALRLALARFPDATHFYLLSGDCMAIKSAAHAHELLAREDADWIESVDFFDGGWIKTGMQEERLTRWHLFNERERKGLFYASLGLQRRLGLRRRLPADIRLMIGSQWWCLRRATVEAVLRLLDERPDLRRLFRWSWIPDETLFQTLVRHLVPREEIRSRSPTFLAFTDYGMPASFHDDHHEMLLAQNALFARKISPCATRLRARLSELWASQRRDFPRGGDGRRLHDYLTGRGRIGERYGPRAWEVGGRVGVGRELLLIVAHKRHVAKRLVGMIRQLGDPAVFDYVFDEEGAALPPLGGFERGLAKRSRHPRAMLRVLFEAQDLARLAICIDPCRLDLVQELTEDRTDLRVLEIATRIDDAYLRLHAQRLKLADTDEAGLDLLMPTLRRQFDGESRALGEAGIARHYRLVEGAPAEDNAKALQAFLDIPADTALGIARTPHLFDD